MRRRCGFTLVELLVVIGIIVLLIAILMPVLGKAKRAADRTRCMAVLRQYAAANYVYLADAKDTFMPVKMGFNPSPQPPWPPPPPNLAPPTVPSESWPSTRALRVILGLSTKRIFADRMPPGLVCPSATLARSMADANGVPVARAYAYNTNGKGWYDNPPTYFLAWRRGEIKAPSNKVMFIDSTDWVVGYDRYEPGGNRLTKYDLYGEVYGPPPHTNIVAYRHDGGANIAFFDGRVDYLKKDAIVGNDRLWKVKAGQ